MWEGQVAPFSKDYQLFVWDMRGHGKSDYPDDLAEYTEAQTVADMAAILDAVGAKKAVIGGLSLGGYMSLAFHLAHPERTEALLIIDTGPGYKSDEPRAGERHLFKPRSSRRRVASGGGARPTPRRTTAPQAGQGRARHADHHDDRVISASQHQSRRQWCQRGARRSSPLRIHAAKIPRKKS